MGLILLRHAEAEAGEPDAERPLTTKGKKQAATMGKWLDRHLPQNCRIICSPTRRTVQTADALGRKYTVSDKLSPSATAGQIIDESKWPAGSRCVLIVGHQPTLGQTASLILAGVQQDWTIRKGNVLWIAQKDTENARPFLRAVLAPDLVGK